MSLTVLSIAYPFAPVGTDAPGGAEQVLSSLETAMARNGVQSVVIACAASRVGSTLISVHLPNVFSEELQVRVHAIYRETIAEAIQRYRPALIHMHGMDFRSYLPDRQIPTLVTLHLPPSWYPPGTFQLDRSNLHLQCVSNSQRRACPSTPMELPVIENGIEVDRFLVREHKRNFALALGRICPEKGFHLALDAAERAGLSLLLAGEVFPYEKHREYFKNEILPRLGRFSRYLGPIGFARKRLLLASARCVIIPSLAPETSSLVAMEALASGTPVIAFPVGALSEIVEEGKTGFLVSGEREMQDALERVRALSPALCRQRARERFRASRMISRYFDLYRRLAGVKSERNPAERLEFSRMLP